MPELPDDDPRMDEFINRIVHSNVKYVGRGFDKFTIQQLLEEVEAHRTHFKQKYGYDAPKMVALVLPTSRYIGLYRADLETRDIQMMLLNMLREFAVRQVPVDKRELAYALSQIWPNYDPAIEFFSADGQAKGAFIH